MLQPGGGLLAIRHVAASGQTVIRGGQAQIVLDDIDDSFVHFFFNDTATTEIYTSFPTRRSSDLHWKWLSFRCSAKVRQIRESKSRSMWPSSPRSEEHTSELQSRQYLVCRLLL